MILPLSDAPNPRGAALVTYALIAVNTLIYLLVSLPLGARPVDPLDAAALTYAAAIAPRLGMDAAQLLAQTSAYDLFVFAHGFRPAAPAAGALFFSLFLHGGFMHLFGNMLFLWIYGDNVEHRLGRLWYLLAYLGTGVAATLAYTLFDAESPLPLIGASGCISGVLGAYFLWFPHNQVRLLVLIVPFFMQVFQISARLVLGMYLVMDNLLPFLLAQGGAGSGGVAHGAHIGGFLAGLALAWGIDRGALRVQPAEYAAAAPDDPDAAATLRALVDAGRFAEAAQLYFSLPPRAARRVLGPVEMAVLGDWLRRNGHDDAALLAYRRQLQDYPRGRAAAQAHLGAGLLELERPGQATLAYQHFVDALAAAPSAEVAARARAAMAQVEKQQKRQVGHLRR